MIEAGLYQRLKADTGVQAALGALPIGFNLLPDGAAGGIELQVISRVPQELLDGSEGVIQLRFQVSTYAKQFMNAFTLDAAVRKCLRGFTGNLGDPEQTRVLSITVDNVVDGVVGDSRLQRRLADFLVLYVES